MCHVLSFCFFEDTGTDFVGRANITVIYTLDDFFFYFHIQSNHPHYTILLVSTAELPKLYGLTNSGIKLGKTL